MATYSLSHLSDDTLLRGLNALVARDRTTTAELLAHIAEVDARKLYLPAGYPSMYAYCVEHLRLSEEAARKRIHAARTARRVPAVFAALADGRLHLSAVVLLSPCLTPENAGELLAAATHRTKLEIDQLIAERCPRLDEPVMVRAIAGAPIQPASSTDERAPGRVEQPSPRATAPRARVAPIAPQRFALQLTMSQSTHDKLRHAQALLSHQIPNRDLAEVLDQVLDLAIGQLEKRKFAATAKPRGRQIQSSKPRTIPARVQRAVWKRDGGQCAFVSSTGHRCSAREKLEFDHVDPVARGGQATTEGARLLCRAHNQYEAERVYGAEFMSNKRQGARRACQVRCGSARGG